MSHSGFITLIVSHCPVRPFDRPVPCQIMKVVPAFLSVLLQQSRSFILHSGSWKSDWLTCCERKHVRVFFLIDDTLAMGINVTETELGIVKAFSTAFFSHPFLPVQLHIPPAIIFSTNAANGSIVNSRRFLPNPLIDLYFGCGAVQRFCGEPIHDLLDDRFFPGFGYRPATVQYITFNILPFTVV